MSAELNVQLRLLLDQLKGDASKAAAIIKKEFGGAMGGDAQTAQQIRSQKLTDQKLLNKIEIDNAKAASKIKIQAAKESVAILKTELQTTKISAAGMRGYGMKDLPKLFGAQTAANPGFMQALGFFKKSEMQGPDLSSALRRKDAELQSRNAKMQGPDLSGALQRKEAKRLAKLSAISLPKEPGGAALAKILALGNINALDKPPVLKKPVKNEGAKYGLLKFAELYVNFKILQTALQSLKYIVDSVVKTFEDARKVFAKSATSGYGIKGTVKMGILSSIIGVSEQDVLKFGSAINYINPRIEKATKILADAALPLTQVSYNIEILKTNLSALFAKMTSEAAPAINNFLVGLDDLVKRFTDHANSMGILGNAGKIAAAAAAADGGPGFLMQMGIKAIQMHGAIITAVSKAPKNLEAPMTFMKQIPASSWEKMGLVIGGRGNTTNELIRQSNKHLSTIAAAVTGTGVARQSFGMNPTVANP